jgi:hypothetical protein
MVKNAETGHAELLAKSRGLLTVTHTSTQANSLQFFFVFVPATLGGLHGWRHDEPRHDEPRHDEPRHDEPRHDEPISKEILIQLRL